MLCTFNLYDVELQLHLNKTKKITTDKVEKDTQACTEGNQR